MAPEVIWPPLSPKNAYPGWTVDVCKEAKTWSFPSPNQVPFVPTEYKEVCMVLQWCKNTDPNRDPCGSTWFLVGSRDHLSNLWAEMVPEIDSGFGMVLHKPLGDPWGSLPLIRFLGPKTPLYSHQQYTSGLHQDRTHSHTCTHRGMGHLWAAVSYPVCHTAPLCFFPLVFSLPIF